MSYRISLLKYYALHIRNMIDLQLVYAGNKIFDERLYAYRGLFLFRPVESFNAHGQVIPCCFVNDVRE